MKRYATFNKVTIKTLGTFAWLRFFVLFLDFYNCDDFLLVCVLYCAIFVRKFWFYWDFLSPVANLKVHFYAKCISVHV